MYYILYLKIPIKVLIKVGNALKGIYSILVTNRSKRGQNVRYVRENLKKRYQTIKNMQYLKILNIYLITSLKV
jgi:hypothetical protein